MTEAEFAEELSRALGPIYRIQLTDEAGQTLVAFGRGPGSNRSMVKVSLPNSVNALLIGIDLDAIVASDQVFYMSSLSRIRWLALRWVHSSISTRLSIS